MKILFLDSPSFGKQDMIDAFVEVGLSCDLFFHKDYKERHSDPFDTAFDRAIEQDRYAFVFSFNYTPILSACCNRHDVKYVSYIYDSPLVALYSCTLINPCNYVFLFDKSWYLEFTNAGIKTVYYMPLAANPKRLLAIPASHELQKKIDGEIAFIGSLYNEEHNFLDRMKDLPEFTKGYLDGIMLAQQKIYGYFFLEELLEEQAQILSDMKNSLFYEPMSDGAETLSYVYANYFLARKISSNERISLLSKLSKKFPLKLYTHKKPPELPHAIYMGSVEPYDVMPLIFRYSRINLNITLRSIKTGIPMRGMDILGAGGFLLTNFQEDFQDSFLPEDDFVYYQSEEDCSNKIAYYLSHEKERAQIAANGLGKTMEGHTFVHRAREMLAIVTG
ncbi:hypothetical protein FACS1894111_10640 [Clostridia bacterium]|nr:hypothetical protein FACS1894111_10640 [Clostridia bacterium]